MKDALGDRLRRVEGRYNALVKELRGAFARGEPTESGACAVEGLRIVEEAIRSGLRLEAVFFSESAQARAERLLPQIGAHVETVLLPQQLFERTVPSESPQGVAALVRLKPHSLEDVVGRDASGVLLAILGLQDPGNLGTILRSAEAFEAKGVLVGDNTVSPTNVKVIRASAGSIFRVPWARGKSDEIVRKLKEHNVRLLATSSHKGAPVQEVSFAGPVAVFIGNEGAGLPRDLMGLMDEVVAIPHSSRVESLNAGVAASIVLYEAARQTR
jgi:RNA methyltransferase, TrmH family